ncbi:lipopolysaccharide transport periplasmic protein LptA [Arenicella xantha]|uniref:Lipopolysaccharide export system protein LptA n=1 Tax=Arenicella xantha TaxID=644221 RepID=A0A395JNK0_9GAMM|nr:lipopolysaccharide transport periplasmic protein LptA [Arenicella xantha]RBP49654.1 lipopolysaccharide transport protein LptA [Arenicella xantha]
MKLIRSLAVLVLSATISCQALALKSDRDQPADIEADDIEFDFKKGTRTYINNVLAVQGTLTLKADKLFAEYNGSELKSATVWGSLARFKQRPDGKEHDVEGWAKKIIVDQQANTLTLIGKASLKQGPQTARGDTIVYNMANDTLKVQGAAKVGAGGKDGTKPKRAIKDPFADNPDGPEPPKKRKIAKSDTSKQDSDSNDETENDSANDEVEEQTETEKPVRSGRSRLIIEPQ